MATKLDELGISKKEKIAEMLANPDCSDSITDMCEKVGIARSTFYKWMEDDEYKAHVNELIDKYTDTELSAVWKSLIAKAKLGDVQAIKLFFELKGKYRATLDVKADAVVQIISDVVPDDDS